MNIMTMHWYPNHIIEPIHANRCMRIIVKENASFNGNKEEFKRKLEEKATEVSEIVNNSANLWKSGKKVSDIRTTDIDKKTKRITNADPVYACALPLPNELIDSQSHNWNQETSIIGQIAGDFVNKYSIMGVNVNKVLGEAAMSLGFRKPMVDPGMFQNYNGSSPRGFGFSFDLIPNNQDEAYSIMNIILNLKKFSLPRAIVSGVSLLSPFIFEIEIGNENIRKLINMNDVVLTEINVNYGADGHMQMFSNGMPKFISLHLSFSERSLVTADFYAPDGEE